MPLHKGASIKAMSTRRQLNAYKEIQSRRHEAHLIKTFGMLPIAARHPGHCPCGQEAPGPYGRGLQACPYGPGTKIAKFRGSWWNIICIERVKLEEFKASARFVLEISCGRHGYQPKAWTNDPAEHAIWTRNLLEDERITDRGAVPCEVAQ